MLPVATFTDAQDAVPLADTLVAGSLPCIEITCRTPAAFDALKIISNRDNMLVGAGTVLTVDQVERAADAGAQFIVSPGLNPEVAKYCTHQRLPHIPGVCTPTEIQIAMEMGFHVLKFFPAEAYGGLSSLKAFTGPFPSVAFIPTGGIDANNLAGYLRSPQVLACAGTWIAGTTLIESKRFDDILANIRQAIAIVAETGAKKNSATRTPTGDNA